MPSDQRYAQMYDEHQPPHPGIEQEIMECLETKGSQCSPQELISTLIQQGFSELECRDHIWFLIDRGYIELTWDLKLRGHSKPISPAPTDLQ